MERVVIVGGPGAGKSTVARGLAERLNLQLVELDALWWEPSWKPTALEEFRREVDQITTAQSWVIEGNYLAEVGRDIVWPRADTLVWLDPPRWLAVARTLRRSVGRVIRRTELWGTNRQGISALSPSSISAFIQRWPEYSTRVEELLADERYRHLEVHRHRSDHEIEDWLGQVAEGSRCS